MKRQKFNIVIKSALLLFLSMFLNGCGTNWNVKVSSSTEESTQAITEAVIDSEVTLTPADSPTASVIISPTTTGEPNPAIIVGSIIEDVAKDLDGNGVDDKIQIISLKDDGSETCIRLYFNGEQIFELEDTLVRLMGVNAFEYLDLDGDNVNEIFITASTNANCRPYEAILCLKQTEDTWKEMEYPTNEDGYYKFPFKITRGKEEFDFIISSDDTDQVIRYDASCYFIDSDSGNDDTIQSYRSNHYKEGDEVGYISSWGVWESKIGTYEGQNCIIAVHGIEGPYGHGLGKINIYYNYNEQGKVKILKVNYIAV